MLAEVEYGNGGKIRNTYDDFDRLTGVRYDDDETPRYEYERGANGEVMRVTDHHLGRALQTEHDLTERPMSSELRNADGELLYETNLSYDAQNRLSRFTERLPDGERKTEYAYDIDNRTTEITYETTNGANGANGANGESGANGANGENDANHGVSYTYDELGRVATRAVSYGSQSDPRTLTSEYSYETGDYGEHSSSPLVSAITRPVIPYSYTYDNRGNITSENRDGEITTYEYDAIGQLIRVNDPVDPTASEYDEYDVGTTWAYSYDLGGNILSKSAYAYTTDAITNATIPARTWDYEYGDTNWKDKLTEFDGDEITYDAIGNPLNDGKLRYEWAAGRQLKRIRKQGDPADGIHPATDPASGTRLKICFSNGNMLAGGVTTTTATPIVTLNGEDITDRYADENFSWTRDSGDVAADAIWNALHAETKSVILAAADMTDHITIYCALTATSPAYGSMEVSSDLTLTHTPGDIDANDVFTLANGTLTVTTDRGAAYALNNGVLYGATMLDGTLTADAVVFADEFEEVIDFAYDLNGLRVSKTVTSAAVGVQTTNYTLHGKLVTHLTQGGDSLHFFYDAQSRPAMLTYNGDNYTYVHNLQGDIVGILDNAGNLVVEYKYDAWGKPTSTCTLTTAYERLAELNPFRYRGYVYDEETGLYYVRSRYYYVERGRFINADGSIGRVRVSLIHNLFAYCRNNPTRRKDAGGRIDTDVYEEFIEIFTNTYGFYYKSYLNYPLSTGNSNTLQVSIEYNFYEVIRKSYNETDGDRYEEDNITTSSAVGLLGVFALFGAFLHVVGIGANILDNSSRYSLGDIERDIFVVKYEKEEHFTLTYRDGSRYVIKHKYYVEEVYVVGAGRKNGKPYFEKNDRDVNRINYDTDLFDARGIKWK